MEKFVRTSKHIKVYLPTTWFLDFSFGSDRKGLDRLRWISASGHADRDNFGPSDHRWSGHGYASCPSVTGLYGVHVAGLRFRSCNISFYSDEFRDSIKKCHITCSFLSLHLPSSKYKVRKEECKDLMRLLRPINVAIDSRKGDYFEVLFESTHLKKVYLIVDSETNLRSAVEYLLTNLEEVDIKNVGNLNPEEAMTKIDMILQKLRYYPSPRLRRFKFTMRRYGPLTDALKQLSRSHPDLIQEYDGHLSAKCVLHLQNECHCEIFINNRDVIISFYRKAPYP